MRNRSPPTHAGSTKSVSVSPPPPAVSRNGKCDADSYIAIPSRNERSLVQVL